MVSQPSCGPGFLQKEDPGGKKQTNKQTKNAKHADKTKKENVMQHSQAREVNGDTCLRSLSEVSDCNCCSLRPQGSGRVLCCGTSPQMYSKVFVCGSWFARRPFTCSTWSRSAAGGQPVSLSVCVLSHATGWVYTHGQLCLNVRLHSPCVFGSWLSSSCVWWDNEVQVLLRRL